MHHLSAVDVHGLAGDVASARRSEKNGECRDILTTLPPSERRDTLNLLPSPFFVRTALLDRRLIVPGLPHRSIHCRLDHSRTDRVNANVVLGEILGSTLCKVDEARFRGAVRRIRLRA